MTRPCSGCGGEGEFAEWSQRYPDDIPDLVYWPCGACLGSGQVEDDSGSDRDSLADATTLMRILEAGARGPRTRMLERALWATRLNVIEAKAGYRNLEDAASLAVRAAFRAVPGLRGEE